jgi:hypothetical protein
MDLRRSSKPDRLVTQMNLEKTGRERQPFFVSFQLGRTLGLSANRLKTLEL